MELPPIKSVSILQAMIQNPTPLEAPSNDRLQNVRVGDLQADETCGFVQKNEGRKYPWEETDQSIGDAYTFIALGRTSKLVVAWHLSRRDGGHTEAFITKVRRATADARFEMCTDAFQAVLPALRARPYAVFLVLT